MLCIGPTLCEVGKTSGYEEQKGIGSDSKIERVNSHAKCRGDDETK
jgi:hypothetical protein